MHIPLLLLTTLFTTSAFSKSVVTKTEFGAFSVVTSLVRGITNFGSIFGVFNNIFGSDYENNTIQSNSTISEDAYLDMTQLANKYGYPIEEHEIKTEDGYFLTVFRIPHGRNCIKNDIPIFLMHGIIDSSDSWILQGPDKSLGYMLADEGFDVWMGNARGNKYSGTHEMFNQNQSEFWKFSWDEIGLYDLPTTIDYILNVTKKENLYYIGYSQGTTSFYVMNSMKPAYNEKIKFMFSLAPVAYMRNIKSPVVKIFSPAYKIMEYLLSFNIYSPSTELLSKIGRIMCSFLPIKCDSILYTIIGNESKYLDKEMWSIIFSHIPCGSSTLQFLHYGQLVESQRFCRYDFGKEKNLLKYGQVTSPDYDLKKITVPIVMYYSDNDWLSDVLDVNMLKSQLNLYDECFLKDFNHLDYLYANTAKDVIYSKIIKQIRDFEDTSVQNVTTKVNEIMCS